MSSSIPTSDATGSRSGEHTPTSTAVLTMSSKRVEVAYMSVDR